MAGAAGSGDHSGRAEPGRKPNHTRKNYRAGREPHGYGCACVGAGSALPHVFLLSSLGISAGAEWRAAAYDSDCRRGGSRARFSFALAIAGEDVSLQNLSCRGIAALRVWARAALSVAAR